MNSPWPALPEGITSFGADVCDDFVYLYGGHRGRAHEYYVTGQSNQLRRLKLSELQAWEELSSGPRLQGLALVAHDGKLYRVGGFSARNEQGEENDLWSVADVTRFDPQSGAWEVLPAMPTPRSSHDAAVVGDRLYVVGGWTLAGEQESVWHKTALMLDLTQDPLVWRELPAPPFQRRALAVEAFDGKLYVIGGMQEQGGPTNVVQIFDPQTQAWSAAPPLQGAPDEGFGAAACSAGGALYVSTVQRNLQRLDKGAEAWVIEGQLPSARFFHQMLPVGDDQLLLVGGANMETGRFRELDVVQIAK